MQRILTLFINLNSWLLLLILGYCMFIYLTQEVDVNSLCDNIEVDRESGDLWLGCHPNGLKFAFHDPNDPPGSEVCKCLSLCSNMLSCHVYLEWSSHPFPLSLRTISCPKNICSPVGYQDREHPLWKAPGDSGVCRWRQCDHGFFSGNPI